MKVFKNVGHFFATAFKAVAKAGPKIVNGIEEVEKSASTVETVTAAIPGAAGGVVLEKVAFAALGAVAAAIMASEAAAASKLEEAGLDMNAIKMVEAALKEFPSLVAVAKSL